MLEIKLRALCARPAFYAELYTQASLVFLRAADLTLFHHFVSVSPKCQDSSGQALYQLPLQVLDFQVIIHYYVLELYCTGTQARHGFQHCALHIPGPEVLKNTYSHCSGLRRVNLNLSETAAFLETEAGGSCVLAQIGQCNDPCFSIARKTPKEQKNLGVAFHSGCHESVSELLSGWWC